MWIDNNACQANTPQYIWNRTIYSFCVWLFVCVFIWLWLFPLFHFTYITVHSTKFVSLSCPLLSFASVHTLRTWNLSCCSSGPCIWYICVARIFCFSVVVFAYEQCCFLSSLFFLLPLHHFSCHLFLAFLFSGITRMTAFFVKSEENHVIYDILWVI